MLPSLPVHRFRHRALGTACALVALLAAGRARALEFGNVTVARDDAGHIWVTSRLEDPLDARVERSLARGMPATLTLHAELWRRREGWFDGMVSSADAVLRLRHDVWRQEWRIERAGAPPVLLQTVDSVEVALEHPFSMPLVGLGRVLEDDRCFVVLTVAVKPLNVEDVEEVEGWLSGEVRDQKRAGFGVITQLPRSVFDAVRNFTGFGDAHDRARTPEFEPGNLPMRGR